MSVAYTLSPPDVAPLLSISGTGQKGNFIEINYEVTHAGFTELHLIDSKKEKIWIKGKVDPKEGSYIFRIPTEPLKPNESYSYELRYKGLDYKGNFTMGTK
jgi:hypothetical protein